MRREPSSSPGIVRSQKPEWVCAKAKTAQTTKSKPDDDSESSPDMVEMRLGGTNKKIKSSVVPSGSTANSEG